MYEMGGKRLFDFLIGLVFLSIASPIMMFACLLVLLVDGFPCYYVQQRIGLNGKPFNLYKIRSMRKGADKSGSTTVRGDSRILFGGNLFRKFKIDELPQLINILKGDMSIVGPRPTVVEDFERMEPEQRRRNSVRPGLTGLAQISGNTSLTWPERIRWDLKYLDSISFSGDLKILINTVIRVLVNRIDSHPPPGGEW